MANTEGLEEGCDRVDVPRVVGAKQEILMVCNSDSRVMPRCLQVGLNALFSVQAP